MTIMLVQIALDTHENVSNNTGSEDSHTKTTDNRVGGGLLQRIVLLSVGGTT
ncbi:hypothetical protein GCM10020331_067810 [Ectobacillus funiculus]